MKLPLSTLVVLATFLIVQFGKAPIYRLFGIDLDSVWSLGAFTLHTLFWYIVLPFGVLATLHGFSAGWRELGWRGNVGRGLMVAFVMTIPMLTGFAILFEPVDLGRAQTWSRLYTGALLAGLSEETFYRAFLFGQLYRYGRWPFLLAVAVQAILFGLSHLFQAHNLGQAAGIFAVTGFGALWFAWLWLAWRTLWVPIFVHILMNAWWLLFAISPTSLGGWASNALRLLTVGVSVWLTLRELRRQGRPEPVWRETALPDRRP